MMHTAGAGPPSSEPKAQAGSSLVHGGVVCDGCDRAVVGVRHKCLTRKDFDLCTNCKTNHTGTDRWIKVEVVAAASPVLADVEDLCSPKSLGQELAEDPKVIMSWDDPSLSTAVVLRHMGRTINSIAGDRYNARREALDHDRHLGTAIQVDSRRQLGSMQGDVCSVEGDLECKIEQVDPDLLSPQSGTDSHADSDDEIDADAVGQWVRTKPGSRRMAAVAGMEPLELERQGSLTTQDGSHDPDG